jgi:chromosome partitioning protein
MKIGITNLKGGVGKTTLSINLAVCFAHMKYKVCIVDTDTNQNSLQWYGAREEALPDVLVIGTTDPKALTKVVDNLNGQHDIIIMDGTPNLSEMNTRVMMASDLLIIPIRPGPNDFRAMDEFVRRLDQVREIRTDLGAYFLINEFDERKNGHKTVRDALQKNFEIPILNTVIKSRTVYGDSVLMGNGVYEHSDDKAKAEMVALTNEVIFLADMHSLTQA